jgi:hypothetical protein
MIIRPFIVQIHKPQFAELAKFIDRKSKKCIFAEREFKSKKNKKMRTRTMNIENQGKRYCSLLYIALLVVFALFAACERPETEPEPLEQLEFAWEDVTDSIPCLLSSINSITLVNDNATLLDLCPDAPTFDFSNHSLVIVSGVAPTEIISIDVNFEQIEDTPQYLLTMHIDGNYSTQPEGWHKYFLIPKVISVNDIHLTICYNDQYPPNSNELFIGEWEQVWPSLGSSSLFFYANGTLNEFFPIDNSMLTYNYTVLQDSLKIDRLFETNPELITSKCKYSFRGTDTCLIENFYVSDATTYPYEFIDIIIKRK